MKRTPGATEFTKPAEEMCSQFAKAFDSTNYWAEKALLSVLLKREGLDTDTPDDVKASSATEEHLVRRAKIFELLGLKREAARMMNSVQEEMELA